MWMHSGKINEVPCTNQATEGSDGTRMSQSSDRPAHVSIILRKCNKASSTERMLFKLMLFIWGQTMSPSIKQQTAYVNVYD